MLYFYSSNTTYKDPRIAQRERVIRETQRLQGNQVFNRSSRFTDISSKRKCKHSYKGHCLITSVFATLFCSLALSDRAISHFIVEAPVKGAMAPAAEPSFLCTFCWTPQFRPAKPRVLGREARIACETCWRSVLDLSICWVCGEIVVRGEEVVSLGWCFWHRGCFGCLICGTSLDPPMEDEDEEELRWIDEEDSDEHGDADSNYIDRLGCGRIQRQRGVELESAPLCSWCENATDGLYPWDIIIIGLENVMKKDGGLSKSRADMLGKTKSKDEVRLRQTTRTLPMGPPKGRRQFQSCEKEPQCRASLLAGAAEMRIGDDGNADGTSNCSSPTESVSSMPAPVYVSVLDAIGEPSFRASKTKPLPRWMTLLPSNRQPTFEQNSTTTSSPEARTSLHGVWPTIDEEPPEFHAILDAAANVINLPSHEEVKHVVNIGPYTTVGSKMEDPMTFKPAVSEDTEVGISNCHTSSDYQAPRPQRSGTSYSFERAVYRPPLNLSIPRSSFPRPAVATTMPTRLMPVDGGYCSALSSQIATPLLSRDETLKKRDVSS